MANKRFLISGLNDGAIFNEKIINFWLNNMSTTHEIKEEERYVIDKCDSIFWFNNATNVIRSKPRLFMT